MDKALAILFWTNLGLLQFKKISDCNQSVFFFLKKLIFFVLIEEQNILYESSGVISPIGFLGRFMLQQLVFTWKPMAYGCFDF